MLRKLDIFDAIENGFELLKKKPIILLLFLLLTMLQSFSGYYFYGIDPYYELISGKIVNLNFYFSNPYLIIFLILSFLFSTFVSFLAIKIAYERRFDIFKAIKFVASKYLIALVSTFLFFLTLIVGLFALVIPGIFVFLKLFFYQYAIIIENKGVIASLERSWDITKGNLSRIFGLFLLIAIIAIFLGFLSIILSSISNLIGFFFSIIFQAFFLSLQTTAFLEAFKKLSGK